MRKLMGNETVEECIELAAKVRDDPNKSQSSRKIAFKLIEICHGVIDLKTENKNLEIRIKELEKKLKKPVDRITATEILSAQKRLPKS